MSKDVEFYQQNPGGKVYWVDNPDVKGEMLFSFDKKTTFNLFRDYPHKLTPQQKSVFDSENPFWRDFFKNLQ